MTGRLELRPGVYRVRVEDGVYFLGHSGPVRLSGASIAEWVERLAPYLDGRSTLAELTAGQTPQRAAMVERVIDTLRAAGVVRIVPPQTGARRESDAELDPPQLRFLRYFGVEHRFVELRSTRVLLAGEGPLRDAVDTAVAQIGLERVRVAEPARLSTQVAAADVVVWVGNDPGPPPVVLPGDQAGGTSGAGTEAVTDLTARWLPAAQIERLCRRAGVPLAQAVWIGAGEGGQAWLVPPGSPGDPGWSAAAARLRPDAGGGPAATPPVALPSPAVAAVAAGVLLQQVLRERTGLPADSSAESPSDRESSPDPGGAADSPLPPDLGRALSPRRLVRVDGADATTHWHRFLAHPDSLPATPQTEDEFVAQARALAAGPRLTEAELSRRVARCTDEQFGVLTLTERDWPQSPLHMTQARTVPLGESPVEVSYADRTHQAARVGAAIRALARYAAGTLDPRRLLDQAGSAWLPPGYAHYPDRALTALRESVGHPSTEPVIWGHELLEPARSRLVPVRLAFPGPGAGGPQTLPGPAADPGQTVPAGLGAGSDWWEAVAEGLWDHCRRRVLSELRDGAAGCHQVDVFTADLDTTGAFCSDLLADLGEPLAVYQVTGSLPVPVLLFYLREEPVAATTADTATAAWNTGLRRVVRAVQARIHGRPDLRPARPAVPAGGLPLPATVVGEPGWLPDGGIARVVEAWRDQGRMPVAVPLDHDPGVSCLLPFLVRVVLCDV